MLKNNNKGEEVADKAEKVKQQSQSDLVCAQEPVLSAEQQIELLFSQMNREEFLEKYIYNDAEITDTVIRRYLLKLKGRKSVPMLGTGVGNVAVSPVKKPKSLEDAKFLADLFISK